MDSMKKLYMAVIVFNLVLIFGAAYSTHKSLEKMLLEEKKQTEIIAEINKKVKIITLNLK